jgi:Major Facilitator Superfamily
MPAERTPVTLPVARITSLIGRDFQPGATIALLCAAASTGVIIPALRALVEQTGHGRVAAGIFSAAPVLGGVVGAALGVRALRRAGSARWLAATALIASIAVTLAMAPVASIELRIALRFLDGGCHLLAITALVATATGGDLEQRARRAVIMGLAIVLGVAGGLGIGAPVAHVAPPEAALALAAVMSGAALITVLIGVAAERPSPAPPRRSRDRSPIAPGLLAFCERFSFGSMTVAMSFLAAPPRVGLVLGVFLVASVISLVAAWRFAPALGPRKLAVRSSLAFTAALAISAAIDVSGSPGLAVCWAIGAGAAAGSLYASALVLATRSADLAGRARGMATVHAAGSAGHALGALSAGALGLALPGMLVIAVPGVAVIVAAVVGVWLTVPEAVNDCPVMSGLDAGASAERTPPT